MSDCIDRQAAIDTIERTYGSLSYQCDGFTRGDAIDILNSLPSAQPERKKGKWIKDNDEHYICDQCGEPCASEIMNEPRDKFCKWCGADMRGEK